MYHRSGDCSQYFREQRKEAGDIRTQNLGAGILQSWAWASAGFQNLGEDPAITDIQTSDEEE